MNKVGQKKLLASLRCSSRPNYHRNCLASNLNRPTPLPTSICGASAPKKGCAVPDCLPRFALPSVLQDAARRVPRKTPGSAKSGTRDASCEGSAAQQIHTNNYLAEAGAGQTSTLGSRNRRGAGAPRGNRNACHRVIRQQVHLKKRLLDGRLRLLVLSAAVAHLEKTLLPPENSIFASNNYLAEEGLPAPHNDGGPGRASFRKAKIASAQTITGQMPYSNAKLDAGGLTL